MVKQFGLPNFFIDSIISKLNGRNVSQDDISNINYFQRCEILNSNPVLLARHFQYCVEVFFKKIIIDGPLGKVKYHVIHVSHFLLSTVVSLFGSPIFVKSCFHSFLMSIW